LSSSGDIAWVDLPPEEARAVAASELRAGLAWTVFGIAVLALSWRMDRLEAQHINPYTVPGLLPGLLGIVTILLGGLLALRSWRRGGRFVRGPQFAISGESARRLALVIGLIVAYTVVLLGRGLPFWLGATIYVTASIVLLQAPQRAAEGRRLTLREMAIAIAIGLASGVGLWLLALFTTVFVLGVLFVIESFEKATLLFALTVKAKDAAAVQPRVERLLQSHRMKYELRSVSPEELSYDVRMAIGRKTDRVSEQIVELDRENVGVQWEEKKEKKAA